MQYATLRYFYNKFMCHLGISRINFHLKNWKTTSSIASSKHLLQNAGTILCDAIKYHFIYVDVLFLFMFKVYFVCFPLYTNIFFFLVLSIDIDVILKVYNHCMEILTWSYKSNSSLFVYLFKSNEIRKRIMCWASNIYRT